jgi:hypothetical protein
MLTTLPHFASGSRSRLTLRMCSHSAHRDYSRPVRSDFSEWRVGSRSSSRNYARYFSYARSRNIYWVC